MRAVFATLGTAYMPDVVFTTSGNVALTNATAALLAAPTPTTAHIFARLRGLVRVNVEEIA